MSFDPMPVLRSIAPYIADWASFHAEYRGATGLQLAVARKGELLVDLAWGKSNLETEEKLSGGHLFRIASHSKTMTAVLVFRLAELGQLRLDDTAGTYVTELEGTDSAQITVRELLGHQGGVIRDSSDADFWQRHRPFLDRDQMLEVLRHEGTVFRPNEHFKYTNIGYSLLGLILERAGGKSYAELSSEHITGPLDLRNTGPEYAADRAAEYAAGHTGRTAHSDGRRVIGHVDTRAMAAATGWYSTARDMTRYGAALAFGDDALLTDASKRLMQREESRVKVRGKEKGRYGLGLALATIGDRELVGHSGGYPGHITITWVDPEDGLVVSALTNAIDGPAGAIADGVIQLIDLAIKASQEKPEPISEDLRVTGRFANFWGIFDVADLGGILHVINPRLPDLQQAHSRLTLDGGRLINESVPGFGTVGEPVYADRDDAGNIRSVNLGAMTSWPIETYRQALASEDPGAVLERLSL